MVVMNLLPEKSVDIWTQVSNYGSFLPGVVQ